MIPFIRDLALLPSIWRRLVAVERRDRFRRSPEGIAQERREVEVLLGQLAKDRHSSGQVRP